MNHDPSTTTELSTLSHFAPSVVQIQHILLSCSFVHFVVQARISGLISAFRGLLTPKRTNHERHEIHEKNTRVEASSDSRGIASFFRAYRSSIRRRRNTKNKTLPPRCRQSAVATHSAVHFVSLVRAFQAFHRSVVPATTKRWRYYSSGLFVFFVHFVVPLETQHLTDVVWIDDRCESTLSSEVWF